MSIAQEFFDLLVIPLRKKVAAAHYEDQAACGRCDFKARG